MISIVIHLQIEKNRTDHLMETEKYNLSFTTAGLENKKEHLLSFLLVLRMFFIVVFNHTFILTCSMQTTDKRSFSSKVIHFRVEEYFGFLQLDKSSKACCFVLFDSFQVNHNCLAFEHNTFKAHKPY